MRRRRREGTRRPLRLGLAGVALLFDLAHIDPEQARQLVLGKPEHAKELSVRRRELGKLADQLGPRNVDLLPAAIADIALEHHLLTRNAAPPNLLDQVLD